MCLRGAKVIMGSENQNTWSQPLRVTLWRGDRVACQPLTVPGHGAENVWGWGDTRQGFPEEAVFGLNLEKWVEPRLVQAEGDT